MAIAYSLYIAGHGSFGDHEEEKQAETWAEILEDVRKANAFYKRFGRCVVRVDYKEGDGQPVKSWNAQ